MKVYVGSKIDELFSDLRKKPQTKDENGLTEVWVTEVTKCRLWSYYERQGAEGEPTKSIFLTYAAQLGTIAHRILEDYFPGASERRVEEIVGFVKIVGRADLVWKDVVFEFKTFSSKKTIERSIHHLAQLAYYMRVLDAKTGFLVYMSRIKPDFYVIRIDREDDEDFIEEAYRLIRKRAVEYAYWLRKGQQPEPEPGSWCSYCPYWRNCSFYIKQINEFERLREYIQPRLTFYVNSTKPFKEVSRKT